MKVNWMKLSVLFILLWAACSLSAQEFTGRVTDPTGAVIPKAIVTAHDVDTGVETKSVTNSAGVYTIPYLHFGAFTVTAESKGFKTEIRAGIHLQVDETSVVNFTMQLGTATESVTVTADTVLDFGKADIGDVVENARVTELPMNGRDPVLLAELAAGVVQGCSTCYQRPFDDNAQYTSINGGGGGNIELLLDGTPNNISPVNITGGSTEGIMHTAYTTPVDSVQEFKMITSPYDAQYGMMAGGVENVILKSGTNSIHGDVYEFARRTWLNANSWENDFYGYKKAQSKWDQYGFELDGPLVIPKIYNGKDKSFFTIQWEHFHALSPLTDTASIPNPAWATGDFSTLDYWTGSAYAPKTIYDPLTSVYNTTAGTPLVNDWVRTQFAGNKVPQGRLDAMAQKMLSYYPAPNVTITGNRDHWAQNYVLSTDGVDTYNNILAKWDQNWSAKDRFSLRYGYWMRNTTYNGNGLPAPLSTGQVPLVARSHTFATEETHTFSPNLLFDFKASVSVRDDANHGGSSFDPTTLGWSRAETDSLGGGGKANFPQLVWGGQWYDIYCGCDYTAVGNTGSTVAIKNSLNLMPAMTWIKGTHTIHAGVDIRLWQNGYQVQSGGPTINSGSGWTYQTAGNPIYAQNQGNDFADFVMGVPDVASNQIWPLSYQSEHYWAPFIQDDWKVARKLTLNLGLRWDFMPAEHSRGDAGNYAFDVLDVNPYLAGIVDPLPGHGGAMVGGQTFLGHNGAPNSDYKTVMGNYQPRVGFAYAVNDKTVIRGGFGKSMRAAANGVPVAGFSSTTNGITSNPAYPSGVFPNLLNPLESLFWGGPTGNIVQPTGFALGLGTNLGQGGYGVTSINPRYKNPSFWSYSLGFERQFLKADSVNVSYVGSRLYGGDSSNNINLEDNALRIACNVMVGGNPNNCNSYNPAANSPNPFLGMSTSIMPASYSTPALFDNLDLSRPMPQFGDTQVNDMNDARTWYNSLQITALHKVSNSLTLHGTETWSKSMDAGTWADQYYGIRARNIDGGDMAHRITISGVYMLPVGRGHMLLRDTNRVVDAVIGGWEFSSLFIMQTGTPQGVPGYYLNSAKIKRHYISGKPLYISVFSPFAERYVQTGTTWSVEPYLGTSVAAYNYDGPNTGVINFMDVPSYAPASVVDYSGIRQAGTKQFDTNLSKNFSLVNRLKLQIRIDAFNVLNHPEWSGGADTTTSDPNEGTIYKPNGASNNARVTQLSAKVTW